MLMSSFNSRRPKTKTKNERHAQPYCECWTKQRVPIPWQQISQCSCGEDNDIREWKWARPEDASSWVMVSEDAKQVTFHPTYSSGTAVVRGDTPMVHDYHYYWEVKMLTETYGTDIMVGVGTNKMNVGDSQFKFTSLLGADAESYGLSYKGKVVHDASVTRDGVGFCRGTIIGVRLDMWRGTLEFFLNRKSQGVSFYNLRRHQCLFPMISSTAAQSTMRLIYAASWRASLLVDATKILSASARRVRIPPGLWYALRSQFWLALPNSCILDDDEKPEPERMDIDETDSAGVPVALSAADFFPSPFMNGFYVDSVDRDYRVVVWQ